MEKGGQMATARTWMQWGLIASGGHTGKQSLRGVGWIFFTTDVWDTVVIYVKKIWF